MLTSLIAVLVLLVIGFYAATIAVIGRAGVGEAKLLRSRRLALGLAGVSALALAYMIYSHPLGSDDPLNQPSAWAAKPLPPSERASAVAAADAAKPVAEPAAAEEPAKAPDSPPAEAAATPAPSAASSEPQSIPPPDGAEPESSLSASAAAMEAELRRRRQAMPALAEEPAKPVPSSRVPAPPAALPAAPAKTPATATVIAPVARRSASAPAPAQPLAGCAAQARPQVASVAPLAYAPLTIVIHNQLGAAQQSERLALVIEGKRVASFEITEAAPAIALPIHLPRPGLLHYRIEGESQQGERLSLQGEGCISATEGARFEVRRGGSDSRRVFLESVING
jgi:hypothetical protein